MIEDIVLFTSIFHFRGLAGSLDDLKGFGSALDLSCGRTNERTEVFQEVLADLKILKSGKCRLTRQSTWVVA